MNYTPDRVRAALEFAKGVGLMPRSHFDVLTWLSENYAGLDFGRCPFDCEDELAERILEAINRLYRG